MSGQVVLYSKHYFIKLHTLGFDCNYDNFPDKDTQYDFYTEYLTAFKGGI